MTPRQHIIETVVKPIAELNRTSVSDVLTAPNRHACRTRHAVAWFLWHERNWPYERVSRFFGLKREWARYAVASYEKRMGYDTCRARWVIRSKNAS